MKNGRVLTLCLLVGCSTDATMVDGGSDNPDAFMPRDAAPVDARTDPSDSSVPTDDSAAPVDAPEVDAYTRPPCTTDLTGEPGSILCTGLRATDADMLEADANIGRDEPMPLLVFAHEGDVYLQIPIRVRRTCGGGTGIMENGEPWAGMLDVEIRVSGVSTPLTVEVEPMVIGPVGAGDYIRIAFQTFRDIYMAAGETEIANDFESAQLGIESAQMNGSLPIFNFGSSGCIPYSNCDCGPAYMNATNMAAMDTFLRNSWDGLTALELPEGSGGGEMDRLAQCETSSWASLRCAAGFVAIAILADRPRDVFLGATGAVIYTALAFTRPIERVLSGAVGLARHAVRQYEFYSGQAEALRHTTTRSISGFPGNFINGLIGGTGFSEDEIACGDCRTPTPSGAEAVAAGCGSGACLGWGDCGCTMGFGCRGYAPGGGFCGACVEESPGTPICIPATCVYENSWFEMPVDCPSRCTSAMTPACR